MSERIDHAAEARVWVSNAKAAQTDRSSEMVAGVYASIANAEATLALVEQQRIANLIAAGEAFENQEPWDSEAPRIVKSEIKEALGL